jgi:ammonia channel protein AmtB
MFELRDLFQWERFITPSIIKIFYWLGIAIAVLAGLQGLVAGLVGMIANPIAGILGMIGAVLATFIGVIVARIAAEFVLIVFRINEHLGAIRSQGEDRR